MKKELLSLEDVMRKIHEEFDGDTDLDKNSSPEELKSFLKFVLADYDESRVYVSDIKKLVSWYHQIIKQVPDLLNKEEKTEEAQSDTEEKEEKGE